MTNPHDIRIEDFDYELAEHKIAKYPLANRDASKLLVYNNGQIKDEPFKSIAQHLPQDTLLIFNDSKVLPVRLLFPVSDTAHIEVFCLEPILGVQEELQSARWKCFVGRVKKWKTDELHLTKGEAKLSVTLIEKIGNAYIVEFSWSSHLSSMHDVLEHFGSIPIPPYLNRKSEAIDTERYQNVFAAHNGSVAAPTAGLHFTNSVLEELKHHGVTIDFATLHVGAGTFKPVQSETLGEHEMHVERMTVNLNLIDRLLNQIKANKPITAVGTTSLRTIESLYWLGHKIGTQSLTKDFSISQWEPYSPIPETTTEQSLQAIKDWLVQHRQQTLQFTTKILILPSYPFKIVNSLVTNFHQPKSTLLLLIAAAVGNDWRDIYHHAIHNDYRFLSYGDSSLLFITPQQKD